MASKIIPESLEDVISAPIKLRVKNQSRAPTEMIEVYVAIEWQI